MRWLTYNQVEEFTIKKIIEEPWQLGNINWLLYTADLLDDYQNERFAVSDELISRFDKEKIDKYLPQFANAILYANFYTLNSHFIENYYIEIKNHSDIELYQHFKKNLIFYHWWDVMTLEQLVISVIHRFLNSTKQLIDQAELAKTLFRRFHSKEDFIEHLFQNFNLDLELLRKVRGNELILDYMQFHNEFKRMHRIIENECRIDHKQKIIGAFFNEDVLFRVVVG